MAYRDELEAARARAEALEEKLAAREAEIEELRRAQARRASPPPSPLASSPGGLLGRQIVAGTLLLSFFTSGYLVVTREPRPMPRKRVAQPAERDGRMLDARGRDARGRDPRGEGPRSRRGDACSSDAARTSASCAAIEASDTQPLAPLR